MTVVFSNTGDVDTRVLAALWDDIPDARVLNIRPRDTREQQRPEPLRVEKKPRPNDPCPCGSGKKYKQCHGRGI